MQTSALDSHTTPNHQQEWSGRNRAGAFDELLVDVQAAQLTAAVGILVDGSGLALQNAALPASARQERVQEETTAAQKAELAAPRASVAQANDGKYDSNARSMQDVPSREHGSQSMPGTTSDSAGSVPSVGKTVGTGKSDERPALPFDSANSRLTGTDTTRHAEPSAKVSESRTAPTPARDTGNAVTVATAGAARAADSDSVHRPANAAQAIGRMLAGRTGEHARAPSTANVIDGAQQPGAKSTRASAQSARPEGNAAPRQRETGGPEGGRRTEFQRLVQSLRISRGGRQSSATIRLNPPTLGQMKVDVRMLDDGLQVRVEASTPRARDLLVERATELTAALREHDIVVERLEVVAIHSGNEAPPEGTVDDLAQEHQSADMNDNAGSESREQAASTDVDEPLPEQAFDVPVMWEVAPEAGLDVHA